MTNSLDSSGSPESDSNSGRPAGWLKLGTVTAASVLTGGILAAWWYRKTLARLRHAEENGHDPHFGIPDDNPGDED
jgi:hypothetical protein